MKTSLIMLGVLPREFILVVGYRHGNGRRLFAVPKHTPLCLGTAGVLRATESLNQTWL